ncbi:unnamed protein product [Camellia sinensis]
MENKMEKTKQIPHVIVLTYPAQGHINPLLQFAKRLASKDLKATLATTHYTVPSIHTKAISIEPISDGYDQSGYNQAPNLPTYLDSFKTVGSKTLSDLIFKYKDSDSPVTCLVYDSLLPWGLEVAKKHGIYGAAFLTNSASVCSMYWQIEKGVLSLPVGDGMVPLVLPGLIPLGFCDMPSFLAQPVGSHSAYLEAILDKFSCLELNDWVFVNSFEELESELANALLGHWPVEMVGPMVPSMFLDQQIDGDTNYGASLWNPIGDQCLAWLDTKPPKSVVYVSFGSMAQISAEQVEEIAWALKGVNKPFLWVLKEPEHEKLPTEFSNSTNQMGLVITWSNQLDVLAHRAVGCFVTHCGWNSTLEGLSLGVPMVAVPQWSDQPMNAKYVEEVWKVAVRASKDGGVARREELEVCIREVMVGERSEEIRRNVSMWRELAKRAVSRGGSSDQNVNKFVQVLLTGEKGKPS